MNSWTTQPEVEQEHWTAKIEELTFNFSRYYSPMEWQPYYYLWRTYQQDFNVNCQGDCMSTADWYKLKAEDAGKVVACPKEIPLGSKIYITDYWTVICHDRWWAIKKRGKYYQLDIWSWPGFEWLQNILKNKIYNPWVRTGYIIS